MTDKVKTPYQDALKTHGTITKAARALGIARSTFRDRLHDERTGKVRPTRVSVDTEEVDQEDHIANRRAAAAVSSLRKLNKDLTERLIATEDKLASMLSLSSAIVSIPEWTPPAIITKKERLVPILFSSDFQCGECIRPEEIDGMNEYNKDVFVERYERLIEQSIDIATHNTGSSEFPGIYYLRGGDAISGGIHAELKDTDDLSSVPAIRHLFKYEVAGIRRLKDRFGRARVISIPGNHGRLMGPWGMKPRSKGYAEHSLETLLAWWIETKFEDDPCVEFVTPMSGDAWFDVEGWKFLLAHGDRMGSRGGQGFVGPAATIARGHQKLSQTWAASGRPIDVILTGHLHTSLKLQRGYANGSLAGYSDFARDIQAFPDAAKQWLLFVQKEKGVAQAFEVQVSDHPRRGADSFTTDM